MLETKVFRDTLRGYRAVGRWLYDGRRLPLDDTHGDVGEECPGTFAFCNSHESW